ncbi:MAG: BNR-4 repeat-containing protein [Sedimentisphaerales bacterium]|nr:BNR-4 repeat-containing protein [Sedimentisphaerales bacterium]
MFSIRSAIIFYMIFISQVIAASTFAGSADNAARESFDIKTLADDGAWTWFNDERVIVDGNVMYIGCVDSHGWSRIYLYRLDAPSDKLSQTQYILSSWQSRDDHNNPSLLKLANGKILAAYAKHHVEKKWYWRLAERNNSGQNQELVWGQEQVFSTEANTTYSNLFQLSDEKGRIYNFIRAVGFNPNILYSDDMAGTWMGPFVLIESGDNSTRPYVKYASSGRDRIDILYTDGHPRDVPNNSVYHIYYKNGSFYKSDGKLIKTFEQLKQNPIVPSDGTKIYDGVSVTGRGWVWDMEYDSNGSPIAVYINSADHAEGNDLRYRYARWNSTDKKWDERQIAYAGTNLYVPENHYAGGITIDPENTNIVYISCDVNPVDGKPNLTGRYQIYRGILQNVNNQWQWTQLTFNTDADNIRPIIPQKHGCKICVIWLQGQYKKYTDFTTHIAGIIEK